MLFILQKYITYRKVVILGIDCNKSGTTYINIEYFTLFKRYENYISKSILLVMKVNMFLMVFIVALLITITTGCSSYKTNHKFNAIKRHKNCQQPRLPSYVINHIKEEFIAFNDAELPFRKICLKNTDIVIITNTELNKYLNDYDDFINDVIVEANKVIKRKIPECYIMPEDDQKLETFYFLKALVDGNISQKYKVRKGSIFFTEIICNARRNNLPLHLGMFKNKKIYVVFFKYSRWEPFTSVEYFLY